MPGQSSDSIIMLRIWTGLTDGDGPCSVLWAAAQKRKAREGSLRGRTTEPVRGSIFTFNKANISCTHASARHLGAGAAAGALSPPPLPAGIGPATATAAHNRCRLLHHRARRRHRCIFQAPLLHKLWRGLEVLHLRLRLHRRLPPTGLPNQVFQINLMAGVDVLARSGW